MVIVPTFAARDEPNDRIVAAVVGRRVVSVAPDMGDRIYRPRSVPDDYRSERAAPDHETSTELSSQGRGVAPYHNRTEPSGENDRP